MTFRSSSRCVWLLFILFAGSLCLVASAFADTYYLVDTFAEAPGNGGLYQDHKSKQSGASESVSEEQSFSLGSSSSAVLDGWSPSGTTSSWQRADARLHGLVHYGVLGIEASVFAHTDLNLHTGAWAYAGGGFGWSDHVTIVSSVLPPGTPVQVEVSWELSGRARVTDVLDCSLPINTTVTELGFSLGG